MNYVQFVNRLIQEKTANNDRVVVFGQNVAAGSCVGGLARSVTSAGERVVINTPNIENTQVGIGFGLMLRGVSSIFIMKQQDFLLLGMDHVVNTFNAIRQSPLRASFTILPIIVDSGYEGPQSCLNSFNEFCSMSHVPGFAITNYHDMRVVLETHLVAPGFRIIGVSQRLFRKDIIEWDGEVSCDPGTEIFTYATGSDVTIVAFNFAFPQALDLWKAASAAGLSGSLHSVSAVLPSTWDPILEDLRRTGRLVLLDDSKSANRSSDRLIAQATEIVGAGNIVARRREFSPEWFSPHIDVLTVDAESIVSELKRTSIH